VLLLGQGNILGFRMLYMV